MLRNDRISHSHVRLIKRLLTPLRGCIIIKVCRDMAKDGSVLDSSKENIRLFAQQYSSDVAALVALHIKLLVEAPSAPR